ncbi:hypothetical protein HHK36_025389 [Tetracentron sinense]|uniref:Uncharacterized protein n=1 Tax=Tetracentron sinense TaxID=13715 RepID=A0A834YGQ9_TETSI|nr:hypothetical protein HHK36_025389 [Tetracentron sinense]
MRNEGLVILAFGPFNRRLQLPYREGINLANHQSNMFNDVIKRVSNFENDSLDYISFSLAAVERNVVVHGQILRQLLTEFPDEMIRKYAFFMSLFDIMKERNHTKLVVEKVFLENKMDLTSMATMPPVIKETQKEKGIFKVDSSKLSFMYSRTEFSIHDSIYESPHHFPVDSEDTETFKSGINVGLRAYVVCHMLEIDVLKAPQKADPVSILIKVRRFFRPEDISVEKAYISDIREELLA